MNQIYIAFVLSLLSRATCHDEYYGEDSGDYDSAVSNDTSYDTFHWPLNLAGLVRQHMALNGAIADPGKSFICSPISALFPLGKLVMGATGNCQSQLLIAIGDNSTKDAKSAFKTLLKDVSSVAGVKLQVCSRIYVSKELKLKPDFENNATEVFRSSIKRVNLNEPRTVANNINNWVNQRTKGMVPDIIRAHDISPDSSIILVNAIYFSGQWKSQFYDAEMQNFYTATSVHKVPMMEKRSEYRYLKSDSLDSQIIEIPYKGGHAAFVIILPNSKDGLPILLYKLKLAPELMQTAMTKMKMQDVLLTIPKFKTTTELDLKVAFKKLSLTDMFDYRNSGLTGLVEGDKGMYVTKAIQKAVIEVDEVGTSAAGASAVLSLLSRATCHDEYYGEDSGDYDSAVSNDTSYDTFHWPLNLAGLVRQHMALNGAIADPGKSFICSPISALFPLGKLVMGATGNCQSQLLIAIGDNSTKDAKSAFRTLLKDVTSVAGVKLQVCSRIYVSKELKLKPDFENNAKEVFRSSIKRVNLNEPRTVANNINNWVNQRTKGMVPDIIRAHDISPDSSIILVNAIYFSGQWEHPFKPAEMQFFYTATLERKVPMMQKDSVYRYLKSDSLDSQIIEIPYIGGHAAFVIILPNSKDGLPILLYKLKLAPELMQTAMTQMKMHSVLLSIPKFKTTSELDLKVAYKNLSLTDMFDNKNSGLTGLVEGETGMYVTKAIQKAVIEVDELGTRAAAASVMEVGAKSLPLYEVVFNANKPFFYFIRVKKEMVFTGVYTSG